MKETKRDIDQLITPLYVAVNVSNESKSNTVRLSAQLTMMDSS